MKEIMEEYGSTILAVCGTITILGILIQQIGSNGVFRTLLEYWCSNLC
ncbi:MAG: hypothetical protein HFG80_00060 [Eubacterium sp.]|nr:hypothetical protein [Eubacterium sp.]